MIAISPVFVDVNNIHDAQPCGILKPSHNLSAALLHYSHYFGRQIIHHVRSCAGTVRQTSKPHQQPPPASQGASKAMHRVCRYSDSCGLQGGILSDTGDSVAPI